MGLYGLAAASGPALAPVISGYAVVANGWRWAFWIMLWLSGFSLALLAFTMPEVSLPVRLAARPAQTMIHLEKGADDRPHPRTSSTDVQSD